MHQLLATRRRHSYISNGQEYLDCWTNSACTGNNAIRSTDVEQILFLARLISAHEATIFVAPE